jgi:hypothetical protein
MKARCESSRKNNFTLLKSMHPIRLSPENSICIDMHVADLLVFSSGWHTLQDKHLNTLTCEVGFGCA